MDINQIKQKTVVSQIMETMKNFIILGKIKPGDKIPAETELAEMFGVSRSSVREAIKVFKYIGVFNSQTKNGTVLNHSSSISKEALTWSFLLGKHDIENILVVRRMIEQEAWLAICEAYISDEDKVSDVMKQLNKNLSLMEEAVNKNDMEIISETDFNFHKIVIDFTKNDILIALFQTIKSFTFEEIRQSHKYQEKVNSLKEHLVSTHKNLYESIYKKDPSKTLSLFRNHIEESFDMVLKFHEFNEKK